MISVTINYVKLPFGLRRPKITSSSPAQYGFWTKAGDWAHGGMAYQNIYWNYGEYLNDWSSGVLDEDFTMELYKNPQDWIFCPDCSEGPAGDRGGMILIKDWSDPNAHPEYANGNWPEGDKMHLELMQEIPVPNKDYFRENEMDIWWPFYHVAGPTSEAEKQYTELEYKVTNTADDVFPFQYRLWWYFRVAHEKDDNDTITYTFDRERYIEDIISGMKKSHKIDPSKPLTPTPAQIALIDSFSNYDSVLNISKKEMITPALDRITPVMNYKVVENPDKTATCMMPGCNGVVKVGDTWQNTCKKPLMIQ